MLYLAMQTALLGVLPWREAAKSDFVISAFMEHIYGDARRAGRDHNDFVDCIRIAIRRALGIHARSIRRCAGRQFFRRVRRACIPPKSFPSCILIGAGRRRRSSSACSFRLVDVIKAILAMRLLVQFIGQAVGVMILRRRWPEERLPYKMWLYPLPALITILGWAALLLPRENVSQ